jgi:ABC-type multidrug transport system fused ATPase/permease subunit
MRGNQNLFRRAIKILPIREKRRISLVILLQIGLGILDLLGVALVGLVGSLAVSGISSRDPIPLVERVLDELNLSNSNIQAQVAILSLAAFIALAGKSIVSYWISKRTSFYLSRRGADLARKLISQLVQLPLNRIRKRTLHENIFALTSGVSVLMLGALASIVFMVADITLLIIIFIGLFFVDPAMAALSLLLFSLAAVVLYFVQAKKAYKLGLDKSHLMTFGNQKTLELFQAYREIVVRDSRQHYAREISDNRRELAEIEAQVTVMQTLGKYVFEVFFLFVIVSISALQFFNRGAIEAVGVLAMFLAASARVSPAILRIQQYAISVRNSLATALVTIELFEDLKDIEETETLFIDEENPTRLVASDFSSTLQVEGLSFSYPSNNKRVLNNVSFSIEPGEFVALVGPSGSGKSTLFDCCLGVQVPDTGSVMISDLSPQVAFKNFPGLVSFVPQDVFVAAASVRENLLLGYQGRLPLGDDEIWKVLSDVDLLSYVESLAGGIDGLLFDQGANLSGGQKQRLGIARALVTQPKFLFLDEATSNLDGQTEERISSSIKNIRGRISIFMIAHRLSTVVSADRIIYLDSGEVKAEGSFQEVRDLVPNFELQAQLMGL